MIIRGGMLALPDYDEPVRADIRIVDGIVVEIGKFIDGDVIVDADGLLVLPGGIDPHVHFNDPGFTEREDFFTATCFSASGGITTVIDMPCTSIPPVTSVANLTKKLDVISPKAIIDYGLFGGVSMQSFDEDFPLNMRKLARYVLGFKTYFISGMESFGRLDHFRFECVLEEAKVLGIPVLLHAEDFDYIESATKQISKLDDGPEAFYFSRPEIAEEIAVSSAVAIAHYVGAQLHIVHLSAGSCASMVGEGDISGETAPHYLAFELDDFSLLGSALKVTPPVKSEGNIAALWQALAEGKISFVASDHAPCPTSEKKTGSIWTDYSGIPGSGTMLPFMVSEGYLAGKIRLSRLVEVTSTAAARRYGISDRKGSIEVGKDADFALFDLGSSWKVRGENFLSKGKVTPFEGKEFKGKLVKTMLRGKIIFDCDSGIEVQRGFGRYLMRSCGT
ncbi:amidohydrolase family protein [bacterium]|nr:amidohydrolase family protein [bacterium]